MSNQKALYSVQDAVKVAWEEMPQTFYSINLINFVKSYIARPMCFDATILRKLRELRAQNPQKYGYKVIDQLSSQYQKSAS